MRDLPTGTVTFLFTDIEGSTELLQELGRDGFVRQLDRHAEIVRTAVAEEGGVEVLTEGDSFFVAFPRASGAIRAAVETQRALAAHPWPDGNAIRVRMGLHTGEGVPAGDNYVGIDVNRAARIAAAGHGGQIIISEATRVLVAGDVPDGVTFRDLGLHDLKGLEHPERLHDLVIDGLSADFPALRTPGAHRTNLVPRRTSFVGRARAMGDIERLLSETRLLTLTGPGGTGKTRLAIETASRQLDRFPDGVFFVDLSPLTDPTLVFSAIAGVLKVREMPGRDLDTSLRRHLEDLNVLLVLDNFEQLVDGSSAVGDLLDAAPGLTVLATSRIGLRLSGEYEYQLAPLELPAQERRGDAAQLVSSESVRLFVDRAMSVRSDFTLTDANASAVAEIVERLDGLPLALELAASRLRVLDPTTLAERLEDRLSMLRGGGRDLPERHRTLEGTIQWSYDMLEPDERRLFARLSVFAGGWTLDAAEAVCGSDDIDVLEGLGALVDDSLVRRRELADGSLRFLMLETIRQFARERLEEAGEVQGLRERHGRHYESLAERVSFALEGPRGNWLELLDAEQENLRAALSWFRERSDYEALQAIAGSLGHYWMDRGLLSEMRTWLESSLESGAKGSYHALVLTRLSGVNYVQGRYEDARTRAEDSLVEARSIGDLAGVQRAMAHLANALEAEGFVEESWNLEQEAAEIARRLKGEHPRMLLVALINLGYSAIVRGRLEDAVRYSEEAVELARQLDESADGAAARCNLSLALIELGRIEDAADVGAQALAAAIDASSDPMLVTDCLEVVAGVETRRGNHGFAARLLGASEAFREMTGFELEPLERALHDRTWELLRQELSDSQLKAALTEGADMDLREAFNDSYWSGRGMMVPGWLVTRGDPSDGDEPA
jgi:predicted ATPase/class 3 adenylate cyclase